MKIWRIAFGLWPSHLTLGRTMQAPFSSCLIGVFALLAALSLASCSSDDHWEKRLTNEQKETYAQNISGEYPGQYCIVYKNKECKERINEEGHRVTEAHSKTFNGVQVDVSDNKMLHVFFQDFPVSLISKVVDADEELDHAKKK